jgi:formate dehydrogenase major subunit/NADH-quinone oxidoreductase subunit G
MSEEISFFIDDEPVKARAGEKILWAAVDNGIDIPHLCAERDREEPFGACRLCFVEVEGRDLPVLSCSEPVIAGMRVQTRSERVDRLRRTAFELLMSHHDLDCKNCARNRSCELQQLAKTLKVSLRPKRFRKLPTEAPVDDSHPEIVLNPNRCILCGKCVWVCNQPGKSGVLDFVFRGLRTRVAPFRLEPLAESSCDDCMRCVDICPVGALTRRRIDSESPSVPPAVKDQPEKA